MFEIIDDTQRLARRMSRRPDAAARVAGSAEYPAIRGVVTFFRAMRGVLVVARVNGLPKGERCDVQVFGFHIHEGTSCTGSEKEPFANALGHYNPHGCPHPQHAGDLPPLFGNDGYAWGAVLTRRFDLREVIGKTVIIHRNPDDFTSQPSGKSGEMIACGVIEPMKGR
jgi:Cu-Zn family superoxide dismutase